MRETYYKLIPYVLKVGLILKLVHNQCVYRWF